MFKEYGLYMEYNILNAKYLYLFFFLIFMLNNQIWYKKNEINFYW